MKMCLPIILLSVPISLSAQFDSSEPSIGQCLMPSHKNCFFIHKPSPQRNSFALHE